MTKAGVYCIRHRVTRLVYIGSSAALERRWQQHQALLNRGCHPTPRLQAAWLADGEAAFEFSLIEECAPERLKDREQWWLDSERPHLPSVGYNELSSVRSDWSNAEFRQLMTAAARRRVKTPEGRAQLKAARANRRDYSTFGAYARSFVKTPRNQFRGWTEAEDALLRARWALDGMRACAEALNRSQYSVCVRANKLGISGKGSEGFKQRMRAVSLERERKRREARGGSA